MRNEILARLHESFATPFRKMPSHFFYLKKNQKKKLILTIFPYHVPSRADFGRNPENSLNFAKVFFRGCSFRVVLGFFSKGCQNVSWSRARISLRGALGLHFDSRRVQFLEVRHFGRRQPTRGSTIFVEFLAFFGKSQKATCGKRSLRESK